MSDYTIILITVGITATAILTLIYIWNVLLHHSWFKIIKMMLHEYQDNEELVDPYKKIEPDLSESHVDRIKAQAEALEAAPVSPNELEKAEIPAEERSQFDFSTSDNGWPRVLSEEERRDPRPFRNVHIGTENEVIIMRSQEADDDDDENEEERPEPRPFRNQDMVKQSQADDDDNDDD